MISSWTVLIVKAIDDKFVIKLHDLIPLLILNM